MNYNLKYNPETLELLGITKILDETKIGFIVNENTVYIPCKNKTEAMKTYKSILRENINCLKKEKQLINIKLLGLKNKLQEMEKFEK